MALNPAGRFLAKLLCSNRGLQRWHAWNYSCKGYHGVVCVCLSVCQHFWRACSFQMKLRYAICVWSGFLSAEMAGQINAFLKRAFKYGFCNTVYTIGATAEEADKVLFKKVMSANHCIHFLLPSIKSSRYSLRARGHPYQLPRCDYELHKRVFYSSMSVQKL